jgi:PAS domain S-box-containing protein
MTHPPSTQSTLSPRWQHWSIRYGGALAATGIAGWVWFLWPVMHQDPFVIFIAAVIVSARLFGFGPALLCTAASVTAIDFFVFTPHFSIVLSSTNYERLVVFVTVSVLTAGLARQRSRAETSAIDVRQRMAAIVESSNDAILSTTPDGIITTWNHGAEQLYGYSAEEIVGKHIALLAAPESTSEAGRNGERLNRDDSVEGYPTEHLRKDGTRVSVLLSISPLRGRRSALLGSSTIARDVTAQQKAEEALRRNEKLAMAGRLSAAIAHEINNPLEAVTSLLYLARRDQTGREEYLDMAEKEVQRISAIAQQTLGFLREGSSPTQLDVAEVLDEIIQLYSTKLDSKHIRVDKQYGPRREVCGFPGELRQLFANLIINAADALSDGGLVCFRIARVHDYSNGYRAGVRVTIADNGTGIRRSDMANLFEPFFTTKKALGTGLGLWLSHGIAQKHGGWIRVRSRATPGRSGTVFAVFLPETLAERDNATATNCY